MVVEVVEVEVVKLRSQEITSRLELPGAALGRQSSRKFLCVESSKEGWTEEREE